MPFKFVDDGSPEADDYASNYVWIDPAPTESRRQTGPPRRWKTASPRTARRAKCWRRLWPFR